MKYLILSCFAIFASNLSQSQSHSTTRFPIPDSIKASQFMAEINVKDIQAKKEVSAGIKVDQVILALEWDNDEKEIELEFPASAKVMAHGLNIDTKEQGELNWNYNLSLNETYKLLVSTATDSAGNFILYSGYTWLPKENKWKLIGTCKIEGRWGTIKEASVFYTAKSKSQLKKVSVQTGKVWLQRPGGWKNLQGGDSVQPVVNVSSHVDSIAQHKADLDTIKLAIASGKTNAKNAADDVYYVMLKEGTGRQVALTDTVVVHYKGSLLSDGSVFDQTRDKPATFPLNRLIRGWHIAVPLCKVGGQIRIVIPSALAYSVRTRAAKIPPNSILVFDIEVLDAKPKL